MIGIDDGKDNRNVYMTHKLDKPRNRKPGFWSISAILLLLMLVIIPTGLLISFSSSQALVVETTQVGVDSAVDAKRIAQKLYHGLKRPAGRSSSISLSEKELNGVVALVARSIDGLEGRVKISSSGVKADFTLRVPRNPFGRYINVTANVAPSSEGLVVNNLAIGSLDISSEMLISIVEIILNRALQDEQLGSELLSSIESVAVNGPKLMSTIELRLRPEVRSKLDTRIEIKDFFSWLTSQSKWVSVRFSTSSSQSFPVLYSITKRISLKFP